MKLLLLILTLICATYAADCNSKSSDADSLDKFEEIMLRKCTRNDENHNAYFKFLVSFHEFPNCVKYAFDLKPPTKENFCNYLNENEFYICVTDLITAALPCLDQLEEYLPDFLIQAYNASYDKICGELSNVDFLFEIIDRDRECMARVIEVIFAEGTCLSELYIKKNFNQVNIDLNKHDVCNDLESFKNCVEPLLQQECHTSYSRFINLIFEPLLNQCGNEKKVEKYLVAK